MEPLAGYFWSDLSGFGSRSALVFDDGLTISHEELDRMAERLRARMDPNWRLVAIEMGASAHAVAALMACLKSGIAAVLLPDGEVELSSVRRRFSPDAVFRQVGQRWCFREEMQRSDIPVHPDLAIVLVTSGSTGEGKAVRISRDALASNSGQIVRGLSLRPEDRALLTLPLHYAYGLSVLMSHLSLGASVYMPMRSILDAGFAEAMSIARPTNLPGVPFTFELLERAGLSDLPSSMRFACVAGGRMDPDRVLDWNERMQARNGRFYVMYGASEATARMSLIDVSVAPEAATSIGIPVDGGRFEVIDEAGVPIIEAGVEGELRYYGPNVMMSYAERRDDLAVGQLLDSLMTGDIGFRREDGLYQIVGRKSRFSKICGIRLGHDALEAAMAKRQLPCAIMGDDTCITAFHERGKTDDYVAALACLTGLGRRRLNAIRLDRIPRLPNGKVDYSSLRKIDQTPAKTTSGVEAVFADSFYPHKLASTDSFARLAGDSLKHVEISLGLERCLKYLPDGWEKMTVGDLSRLQTGALAAAQTLPTDIVIRTIAILMVVTQHATLWPIPGGAAAMAVLLGHAMARFQLPPLVRQDFRSFFRPLLRVLIPYYLILAGYILAWGQVPWTSVFLAGNFGIADPVRHTMIPYLYWFIEAFSQMLVLVAGLFLIPSVRRLGEKDPFRLGLCFLGGALALRFMTPLLWDVGNRKLFTLPWIMPLAALGWCAAHAETARRRLLLLVTAFLVMPMFAVQGGNWIGSWVKYTLQFAAVAALMYAPGTAVPSWLRRPVLVIAHSSLHIYLFHRFVPELLMLPLEQVLSPNLFTAVAIGGGIALGIATARVQTVLVRILRRRTGTPEEVPAHGALVA